MLEFPKNLKGYKMPKFVPKTKRELQELISDESGTEIHRLDFSGISGWDVSGCENMSGMFSGCYAFNQPLNSWNTSKVRDMSDMFSTVETFNQGKLLENSFK